MTAGLIVTGTDTGIGKTVAAAALTLALGADYWKPVQAGLDGETDRQTVQRLTGVAFSRLHEEAYRLATPASPHHSAMIDGIEIDPRRLVPPVTTRPLVIEGAGGLLVPLRLDLLQIDVFAGWGLPLVLCASTRLGTINHTLLSIEAIRNRAMPLAGVMFMGTPNGASEQAIVKVGKVPHLGRLPWLEPLDTATLTAAAAALDLGALRRAVSEVTA